MAQDLPITRRAAILAEGLKIDPGTFAGRDADAFDAMILVRNYRHLQRYQQEQVLGSIQRVFPDRPAFFTACQLAIADQVANPQWVPGTMSNDEVYAEAHAWDRIQSVSAFVGGGAGLAEVGSKQLRGAAGAAATAGPGMFWSTFLTKIKAVSPPLLFFAALQTVSKSSSQTWRLEMKRRLQSGEMLPEDVRRRYGDLK